MSRRRPSLAPWKRGIVTAVALFVGITPVQAADPPAAIVVFDGSGSMWGRMEGERPAKLAIARDALKAPMSAVKPDVRLGLASYGHRRQADCNDVQVIVPPEAGSAERIGNALGREATVYVRIPAARSGAGKVQMSLQNRIVEYQAFTDEGEPLQSGESVEVVDVSGSDTVYVRRIAKVAPQREMARS